MFESLIQVLHQLALNALGLILALLSGELPVSPPPPPEPAAQQVELRLQDEPPRAAHAMCGLSEALPLRVDAQRST
jgi:hypothetical protein